MTRSYIQGQRTTVDLTTTANGRILVGEYEVDEAQDLEVRIVCASAFTGSGGGGYWDSDAEIGFGVQYGVDGVQQTMAMPLPKVGTVVRLPTKMARVFVSVDTAATFGGTSDHVECLITKANVRPLHVRTDLVAFDGVIAAQSIDPPPFARFAWADYPGSGYAGNVAVFRDSSGNDLARIQTPQNLARGEVPWSASQLRIGQAAATATIQTIAWECW